MFLIFLLMINCKNNEIALGGKLNRVSENNSMILIPSGGFVKSENILIDNIEYVIGINSNLEVIYISTKDTTCKFGDSGIMVGSKLSDIDMGKDKLNYIPGWGYYIKINSIWYAGFDFDEVPNDDSRIGWLFQYEFSEKKEVQFFKNTPTSPSM
tara:strand:- start:66 stop:527 length:462 start_codon:yes stop_codon:yes gene_type:complete